mmetsp:Transcript_40/g.82  ORF Transcript_40/g.82 Transcript_40/m.82 type:complete len:241 (+) Transcript_40:104-826(+)
MDPFVNAHTASSEPTETYHPLLEFKAGVTACLSSWSALRTAVEGGWGGGDRESQRKAEDLRNHIFAKLDGKKCLNYDAFDLADDLAIYIEEEFSVTLEDDSERQLAETIFQIYEQCLNGDPSLARRMVALAASAVALNSQFPVTVQTTEHDDDDEDMEVTESPTMVGMAKNIGTSSITQQHAVPSNLVNHIALPLFGKAKPKKVGAVQPIRQLGEEITDQNTVEMDEDGFAPVKKGNRRR